MAFTPVQPVPITSNYSLSGGAQYVPSGTVTSGTNAFPGPHLIETQTLNIDYVRVPRGIANNFQLTLSSASMNHSVTRTEVLALVTAEYKREKSYNTFSTSSYTQPQTFQILAMSADSSGNSYGALTASSFGPMGTVATYHPYHSRRPWDDTLDTTILQTCYGANFIMKKVNGGLEEFDIDQSHYINDFKNAILGPLFPGTFLHDFEPHLYLTIGDTYMLFGSYSPQQESVPKIINFINSTGIRVASSSLFKIPGVGTTDASGSVTFSTVGVPNYSPSRHDYTTFY